MKRLLVITAIALTTTLFFASGALAATMQFTADNEITSFTETNGLTGTLTGNLTNWTQVSTYEFTLVAGQTYNFHWDIINSYGNSSSTPGRDNPMAFIAMVDLDDDGTWDLFSHLGQDSPWSAVSDSLTPYEILYGSGNDDWATNTNAPFTGAYWLGFTEASTMSVSFCMTAPTPIPGAVWLLGSGLVGLIGLRSKKRRQ